MNLKLFIGLNAIGLMVSSCVTTETVVLQKCPDISYKDETWICTTPKNEVRPLEPKEKEALQLTKADSTQREYYTGWLNGESQIFYTRQWYEMLVCYRQLIHNRNPENLTLSITYNLKKNGEVATATINPEQTTAKDSVFIDCVSRRAQKAKFLPLAKTESYALGPWIYTYKYKRF